MMENKHHNAYSIHGVVERRWYSVVPCSMIVVQDHTQEKEVRVCPCSLQSTLIHP